MDKQNKSGLRNKFKNIRNTVNLESRIYKSEIIRDIFIKEIINKNTGSFFIYKSFSSEVCTEGIIEDLFACDKKVLIPGCDLSTETMHAVEIFPSESFKLNLYGIAESSADKFYDDRIDVIVVPGLVFDKKGNRIGYGKGYYDKFINSLNYKPIIVGLCYEEQVIDYIDANNEYDAKLDYLITDTEFHTFIDE